MSTEETKVAVMQKQVEYVVKQVDDISKKIDDLGDKHPTKSEHTSLEKRVENLEDSNKWLSRTIGGTILTVVLTGSILAFVLLK